MGVKRACVSVLVVGALGGCLGDLDSDQDGVTVGEGDCSDTDPAVNPSAEELCDGLDNNCSGQIDEGFDADLDGYRACVFGGPALEGASDCDDTDAAVYPGAEEVWGDGVDGDCDGLADADLYVTVDGAPVVEGAQTFSLIQEAIDAATDGQVIAVGDGEFTENITFAGKAITLTSLRGPEFSSINGGGEGSTVLFVSGEGEGSVLRDLRIKGGAGSASGVCGFDPDLLHGGGVCIRGSSPTIKGNLFTGNSAPWGAGLYVEDGYPLITSNVFQENRASWGGAVYARGGRVVLRLNGISDNVATVEGGGLYLDDAIALVEHNAIARNRALSGGGIYVWRGGVSLLNNQLVANEATAEGGGAFLYESDAQLRWNEIQQSTARDGAGLYLFRAVPTLMNNALFANKAEGSGGGLFLTFSSAPELYFNVVADNEAASGGGIFSQQSSPTLEVNLLAFNKASGEGPSAYVTGGVVSHRWNGFYSGPSSAGLGVPSGGGGEAGVVGFELDSTDFVDNPLFIDDISDGDALDDNFHLGINSPGLDRTPADEERADPDGSRGNAGAFGGPEAGGWDLDGDGYYNWWSPTTNFISDPYDCDDRDPAVYPGEGC